MLKFIRKIKDSDFNSDKQKLERLIDSLEAAKCEISELDASLDYITDPLLMSQIIFERKAAEMRYRYCLKLVKENDSLSE